MNIFETPIYFKKVEDSFKIDESLKKINLYDFVIHTKNKSTSNPEWQCNVYTGHSENLVNWDHEWVNTFYQAVHYNVIEYVNQIREIQDEIKVDYSLPWINIYEQGHHQETHNHLGNNFLLSYCYLYRSPPGTGSFGFYNNNSNKNWYGQESNIIVRTQHVKYIPKVEEGYVIIFPSYLDHYVTENKSNKLRVTISGNISLRV